MIKIILAVFICSSFYHIGYYNGSRYEEFIKCQEKFHNIVKSGKIDSNLQHASFDILYKYSLGWAYQCAFLRSK